MAFVLHPDGGYCNTEGMTDECYGCYCYGTGDVERCRKRVKGLKIKKQNDKE